MSSWSFNVPPAPHQAEPPKAGVIIVVMGMAGTGKAAIAPALAASLGCPHLNANWLLSAENHARLEQGQPLVDVDRIAWMQDVFEAALEKLDAQTAQPKRVVVAVSALKKAYRDIQRGGAVASDVVAQAHKGVPAHPRRHDVRTVFVYLKAPPAERTLSDRLHAAKDALFSPKSHAADKADLEEPTQTGEPDVLVVAVDPASVHGPSAAAEQRRRSVVDEAHAKLREWLIGM